MKENILRFLNRIIGLKHINFYLDGIYFLDFPMFLLPIKSYSYLITNLSKFIGINKTKKIFSNVGYNQGFFGIDFFLKKYNILVQEGNYSFYLEQTESIGLGKIEFIKISPDKSYLEIKSFSVISLEKPYYDFYLEGLVCGACSRLFNKKYSSKVEFGGSEIIFKLTSLKKSDYQIFKNYTYRHISLKSRSFKKNSFFIFLKKRNQKLFYSNSNGTFFNSQKYMFTLISIFVFIYYLSLKEDLHSKKVFFNLGEFFGDFIYNNFKNYFKKFQDLINTLPIFGFNSIMIVYHRKNSIRFKILEGNFESISKKSFPEDYSIMNNDFLIGIIKELFCSFYGYEDVSFKILDKKNFFYLEFNF